MKRGGEFPAAAAAYQKISDEVYLTDEDMLAVNSKLLIPRGMRKQMLERLHRSHMGTRKTLQRARQAVHWPGISNDVKNTCKSCRKCVESTPRRHEVHEEAPYPVWQALFRFKR